MINKIHLRFNFLFLSTMYVFLTAQSPKSRIYSGAVTETTTSTPSQFS